MIFKNSNIIIFQSPFQAKIFMENKNIFADGTFFIAPTNSYQVFITRTYHLLKTEKLNAFKKLSFIMLLLCLRTPNFTINFGKMLWLLPIISIIGSLTNLTTKLHMNFFIIRKLILIILKFSVVNVISLFPNNSEQNLKDLLFLVFSLDTTNLITLLIKYMMLPIIKLFIQDALTSMKTVLVI